MNNQLLKQLRSEIDQIDYDILRLIKKRQQTAEMIGMVKYENNMKIYHPAAQRAREDIILDKLKSQGLVNPKLIDDIWKNIFENSKWLQKN
jgi:chorismate mutase